MSTEAMPVWFQPLSFWVSLIKHPCSTGHGYTLMYFRLEKEENDNVFIHYSVNFDYTIGLAHNPGAGGSDLVPSEYFINCDKEGLARYIAKKYADDMTFQDVFDHPDIDALFMLLEEERTRSPG